MVCVSVETKLFKNCKFFICMRWFLFTLLKIISSLLSFAWINSLWRRHLVLHINFETNQRKIYFFISKLHRVLTGGPLRGRVWTQPVRYPDLYRGHTQQVDLLIFSASSGKIHREKLGWLNVNLKRIN